MQPPQTHRVFQFNADHQNKLGKSGARHKYDYGHAVIISGPPGQGGSARLAAHGALRIGAGLVSVLASQKAQAEHAAHLNAIMVKTYANGSGFDDALTKLKPSAICIGPNLGVTANRRAILAQVLARKQSLCLDADALTIIASNPDIMPSVPHAQTVMTPHEGELRRLIPAAFKATTCRMTLAQNAAQAMNCCVLFKGQDTIVSQPNLPNCIISSKPFHHAAWLATAGSGDVLAGIITGLLARGFSAFDAATLGAHLHLQCADAVGPGLIAEDIPEAIPHVLATCLETNIT